MCEGQLGGAVHHFASHWESPGSVGVPFGYRSFLPQSIDNIDKLVTLLKIAQV